MSKSITGNQLSLTEFCKMFFDVEITPLQERMLKELQNYKPSHQVQEFRRRAKREWVNHYYV